MKCDLCGADAIVILPGDEYTPPDCYCLACAIAAGFPWLVSEPSKQRRRRP